MDQFHHEQHAFTLAQQQASAPRNVPDEETSWVMLSEEGQIVRLEGERFLHTADGVSLDMSAPKRPGVAAYSVKSGKGTAYITNKRLIYLPDKPTADFRSFSAPILHCGDTHLVSPIFGPWAWVASVEAVPDGGVPTSFARVNLKLSFNEGRSNDFREKFEVIKSRLEHAVQMMRESGATNIDNYAHDEQLPRYEASQAQAQADAAGSASGSSTRPPQSQQSPQQQQPASSSSTAPSAAPQTQGPIPDEPPPGYDEAQAQAIGVRLDQHLRREADREGS